MNRVTDTYICVQLIQKVHNVAPLNLCIALALGLVLFLTRVQTATANVLNGLMNIHTYVFICG